jgi:tetratricopeptide (TPR) repeat protein
VAGAVPVLPDPDPRLAHARALQLEGQLAEALAEAGSVAAEARRTGNLALLAEAELLRGKLLGPTARLQDATEVLLGAVRTAEAAGRPDLRAEGMLLVAGLEARDPAAGPRATLLLEQARHIIVAQDLHERLGHAADFIEASIDSGAGRHDRAVDGFGRALEGAKRALPPDHPFLDQYRWSLAVALGSVGKHEAAAALYVHSRAEVAAVLGPTSPRFALHLAALGALQVNTGAPEAARVDLEAAVALLRERLGDDAQPTLDVRADLARCLEMLGREDEARAHLSDVVSRTLKSGSPAIVAEAYADLGDLELRVGALAAATSAYETALSWAQRGAADTSTEARMLTRVAVARLEAGDDHGVRALLEDALAIHEMAGDGAIDLAEAEFALARASWSEGSDLERALVLAERARDRLGSNGLIETQHREEIERWLGERLGPP